MYGKTRELNDINRGDMGGYRPVRRGGGNGGTWQLERNWDRGFGN